VEEEIGKRLFAENVVETFSARFLSFTKDHPLPHAVSWLEQRLSEPPAAEQV